MCGIVGIADHRYAVPQAYLGLFALQHRGQEAAGLVSSDGRKLYARTGLGLVVDAIGEAGLAALKGRSAVGHVRYATSGDGNVKNAQPLVFEHVHGPIAIAHNGTLTNALTLRRKLEHRGAIFQSTTDSEVIVHLIARHPGPVEDAIIESLRQVEGAYSLLFLTSDKLIAARDPLGFRPLCLGRLGKSYVFASETTALHQLQARFIREVEPGEILIVEGQRLKSLKPLRQMTRRAFCVFEQVYFARPDSTIFGRNVQASRRALGRELAREMASFLQPAGRGGPAKADLVIPVPDSGVPAALGFSSQSGIELEMGFVRSHYIGRTFIQPAQVQRDSSVSLKLSPVRETLKGKRIVLIDDSIVRGTTSRRICRMLKKIGVKEIHMAISSPPIVSPCYYGIDTPSKKELIGSGHSVEEIRRFLGVESLHYLSLEGMIRAAGGAEPSSTETYCTACFTGKYPTPITDFSEGETPRRLAGDPHYLPEAAAP